MINFDSDPEMTIVALLFERFGFMDAKKKSIVGFEQTVSISDFRIKSTEFLEWLLMLLDLVSVWPPSVSRFVTKTMRHD